MKQKELMIHAQDVREICRMGDEEAVVLNRTNLKTYKGEVRCTFGTSGSGKSTLLDQLTGVEKPIRERVPIQGINVSQMGKEESTAFRQKHTSLIFRSYNLLPSMTAVGNVALPLMPGGIEKEKREGITQVLLRRVGLSHRLHRYPGQISGGQQQRAGTAWTFVTRSQVVLADKPTGNLDSKTTEEVIKMIIGFARKYHRTIILVIHDPDMARSTDRIVALKDGSVIGDERMDGYAESM